VWSSDGARLFYSTGPKLQSIVDKPANGTGKEKEWLTEPDVYHYPTSISPDGRFLLYFTMPAPAEPGIKGQDVGASAPGRRPPDSPVGRPVQRESRRVFAGWPLDRLSLERVRRVRAVRAPGPVVGRPKPLFTTPCGCAFDVSPDGQRFLVRGTAGAGGAAPITVVLNWQAELKRR
jgi:hypothetical protein